MWKGESARLGNSPPIAGLVLFYAQGLVRDTRGETELLTSILASSIMTVIITCTARARCDLSQEFPSVCVSVIPFGKKLCVAGHTGAEGEPNGP